MKRAQLNDLWHLVQAKSDADQANLSKLRRQEAQLQDSISNLTSQQSHRALARSRDVDMAAVSGVDMRWEIWAEQRKKNLNQQLARLRVDIEQARFVAQKSFAQSQAAQELCQTVKRPDGRYQE